MGSDGLGGRLCRFEFIATPLFAEQQKFGSHVVCPPRSLDDGSHVEVLDGWSSLLKIKAHVV